MVQRNLLTTVVGSYPQPDWLIDREAMKSARVPRVRYQGLWRIPEQFLAEAQNDATLVAIRDMERAGLDTISDGEIGREGYSNRFATALEGIDIDQPGESLGSGGNLTLVPGLWDRSAGPGRCRWPTWSFGARIPRAESRLPCQHRSLWPNRP